jgi:hypothetical protein
MFKPDINLNQTATSISQYKMNKFGSNLLKKEYITLYHAFSGIPQGLPEESLRTFWGVWGLFWDFLRTFWGISEESEDSLETPWGLPRESLRNPWGHPEDSEESLGTLWKIPEDFLKIQLYMPLQKILHFEGIEPSLSNQSHDPPYRAC